MTGISVGGASSYHAPLEVNAPAALQAAELGGHTVSKSNETRISESSNSTTSKISEFFEGMATKQIVWSQTDADAAADRRQEAASSAVSAVFSNLKDGRLAEAYQSFTKLHHAAEKLEPNNPRGFVSKQLQNAASQFSTQERDAIRLHDFKGDGDRLVRGHSAHAERALHVFEGLVKGGLMSVGDLSSEIHFIDDIMSEIPSALRGVKTELTL
ncbi:hypothetical protein PsAD13_05557 [Pseudovibrio sp. Ad13]|uniref:hypothetical protein n=1 Tax=Pseudovibrio sp. Ad13 TaxID=989396 RepID=UPI0007AE7D84|nr:hypothetical protein [Pseudovibrio sp. Ad13]KZK76119.1 hypothetical protein PsAD13_05557 [Pseudovibrio sp. Ad13]